MAPACRKARGRQIRSACLSEARSPLFSASLIAPPDAAARPHHRHERRAGAGRPRTPPQRLGRGRSRLAAARESGGRDSRPSEPAPAKLRRRSRAQLAAARGRRRSAWLRGVAPRDRVHTGAAELQSAAQKPGRAKTGAAAPPHARRAPGRRLSPRVAEASEKGRPPSKRRPPPPVQLGDSSLALTRVAHESAKGQTSAARRAIRRHAANCQVFHTAPRAAPFTSPSGGYSRRAPDLRAPESSTFLRMRTAAGVTSTSSPART